jgi:hypothetical protein
VLLTAGKQKAEDDWGHMVFVVSFQKEAAVVAINRPAIIRWEDAFQCSYR